METTLLIGLTWHFQYVYFVLSSSSKCSMNNGTDSSTKFPLNFSRQWGELSQSRVPLQHGVGGLGLGSSALSLVPRRQGSMLQEGQGSSLEKKLTQGITAPLKNKDVEKPLRVKATKAETGRTFRVSLKPRRASLVAKMAKNCLQCGRPRIGEPGELRSMGLQRVNFLKPRKWGQPGNCLGFLVRPMDSIPSCFSSRTLGKCANSWVSPVWYLKSCQGYESGPCFKIQMKDSSLSIYTGVTVWSLSHIWLFATPCTVAHQASLSMELSRQENWSGLSFPSPVGLPDPGIKPRSLALQVGFLPLSQPGSPIYTHNRILFSLQKDGNLTHAAAQMELEDILLKD